MGKYAFTLFLAVIGVKSGLDFLTMGTHAQRPVFLNLFAIRLPPTAVTSILHRISGTLLFIALPPLLYFLDQSLRGPEEFEATMGQLGSTPGRLFLVVAGWAFFHHLAAGLRLLLLDLGRGTEFALARRTAVGVSVFAAAAAVVLALVLI